MESQKPQTQTLKKKGHNNNSEKVTTILKRSQQFTDQETLFGMPKVKLKFNLNENHKHLLEIFALNPESRLSRNILIKYKSKDMHVNTVSNFLIAAEVNGLIEKQRIIQGTTINTAYYYQKYPNTFEDGTVVKKSNSTYYRITKLGIIVDGIN